MKRFLGTGTGKNSAKKVEPEPVFWKVQEPEPVFFGSGSFMSLNLWKFVKNIYTTHEKVACFEELWHFEDQIWNWINIHIFISIEQLIKTSMSDDLLYCLNGFAARDYNYFCKWLIFLVSSCLLIVIVWRQQFKPWLHASVHHSRRVAFGVIVVSAYYRGLSQKKNFFFVFFLLAFFPFSLYSARVMFIGLLLPFYTFSAPIFHLEINFQRKK